MKRSTQAASAATDHALAQIQAQDPQSATEVRNTDLAAVMSMFGHRPRRIDGAILMEEEGGKPYVVWFIPKSQGEQGMSTGAVAKAWENGMGASARLETLIEEAADIVDGNARTRKSRLAKVVAEIQGLQYISQVEAARVAFQEKQWLMQLLHKLKKSGNNQFIIERRDGKVAMFGAGMDEKTIADMKEVANY